MKCEDCKTKWCCKYLYKIVAVKNVDECARLLEAGYVVEGDRAAKVIPAQCRVLSADGKCMIYEHRPAECRDFYCAYHDEHESWKKRVKGKDARKFVKEEK